MSTTRYLCPDCSQSNVVLDIRADAFLCLSITDGVGCHFSLDAPFRSFDLLDYFNRVLIQDWISTRGEKPIRIEALLAGLVVNKLTLICTEFNQPVRRLDAQIIVTRVFTDLGVKINVE